MTFHEPDRQYTSPFLLLYFCRSFILENNGAVGSSELRSRNWSGLNTLDALSPPGETRSCLSNSTSVKRKRDIDLLDSREQKNLCLFNRGAFLPPHPRSSPRKPPAQSRAHQGKIFSPAWLSGGTAAAALPPPGRRGTASSCLQCPPPPIQTLASSSSSELRRWRRKSEPPSGCRGVGRGRS